MLLVLDALEQTCKKRYFDGTDRTLPPRETLANTAPFLEAFGITRVANVTGLDIVGIPVIMVVRPNARSLSVSQGKSLHLQAAIASGIMESLELHHAEHIELPLRYATFRELRNRNAVADCLALPQPRNSIFHEDLPLLWLEGTDLISRREMFVPFEAVSMNWRLPLPTGSGCFSMTSNGLASGNSIVEAISHGICELVERDAAAIASMSTTQLTKITVPSIDDTDCKVAISCFLNADIEVSLFDCTSDVGIPTISCLISDAGRAKRGHQRFAVGYGSHLQREKAALRALTEAAQSRLTLIAGSRDDIARRSYDDTEWMRGHAQGSLPEKAFAEVSTHPTTENLADDVRRQLRLLSAAGLDEVVVVGLSSPGDPFAVVRILIPGLEGMHTAPFYRYGKRAMSKVRSQRS